MTLDPVMLVGSLLGLPLIVGLGSAWSTHRKLRRLRLRVAKLEQDRQQARFFVQAARKQIEHLRVQTAEEALANLPRMAPMPAFTPLRPTSSVRQSEGSLFIGQGEPQSEFPDTRMPDNFPATIRAELR